jgi:hypothetical protein
LEKLLSFATTIKALRSSKFIRDSAVLRRSPVRNDASRDG